MPLFNKRSSMLEVQNRALIKTAKERAEQIEKLERELQTLRERAEQADKIVRELQSLREEISQTNKVERDLQQARSDIERITLERDFYSKKASALEQENRELTESATKYSVHAQKLEWELTEVAIKYSQRAQNLDRTVSYLEITETVTLISDTPRILTFVPDTRRMKSSSP